LTSSIQARVLVIGAYGRMGTVLTPILEALGHTVFLQGRGPSSQTRLNPTILCQLSAEIDKNAPDVIINLAALTNVDECETNPHLAYEANTKIVETIAAAIQISARGIHLVQISTDHLYYESKGFSNEADIKPINMYAITKYAGEIAAQSVGATILRTNFIGRGSNQDHGLSVSDWIIKSLLDRRLITLFDDVIFSPLHIKTLCQIVAKIVMLRVTGIYNLGSIGAISKADFGKRLASELNLDMSYLQTGKLESANMKAKRPLNMTMNCQKFIDQFKVDLPNVNHEVDLLIKDYKDN